MWAHAVRDALKFCVSRMYPIFLFPRTYVCRSLKQSGIANKRHSGSGTATASSQDRPAPIIRTVSNSQDSPGLSGASSPLVPSTLKLPSGGSRSRSKRRQKKFHIEFPIPGVVIHSFSSRVFKECVKYYYSERGKSNGKYNMIKHRYTNVFISPIGLFEILSLFWLGSEEETSAELSHFMTKVPHYQSLGNPNSSFPPCLTPFCNILFTV